VKHYPLHTLDDIDALCIVFDHIRVIKTPQSYSAFKERVGNQGVAVARGPMAASPMHLILHELTAMDQFFYFYHDAPDKLNKLCDHMIPFFDAALDALVHCDAEVVFWGANYDQDLTWPPFFDQEITPWLQKVAKRMHDAGKILLTHCDGENKNLLPHYRNCGFDIAESVCPAPMTQCTLAELRASLPNITIWGGIPSIALLPHTMSDAEFEAYLCDLFKNLGRGDHLILGVSDNVPPDADLTRLDRIREMIEQFGCVNPA
jgi:uroporphyrinogen-III decarboxylase